MEVTSVAITGVSGRIGQALLRALAGDPAVDRVVGVDVEDPALRLPLLEFHPGDVAEADLKPLFEGVDVVVHLAFLMEPLPDEGAMERVNVEGTRRVLDAAAAATGVGKVVLVSSGAAYGAWPNNPTPITEDGPLRPNRDFAYAVHLAEAERVLGEWRDEHPGVVTTVLRPAFVLGGDTPAAIRTVVRGRLPFRVRDGVADVQYVHVDDVASAVALAVRQELEGVYNVAPDGWIPHDEAAALGGHVPRIAVSADVADRMLTRLWRSGVGDVPPGLVPFMVHPCVLANDRLKAAGWKPDHSNEDAVIALLEETGEVTIAPNRARQVAVVAGAAAAVVAVGFTALRRWRR